MWVEEKFLVPVTDSENGSQHKETMASFFLRTITQINHRKNVFQGLLVFTGLFILYYIFHTSEESKRKDDFIEEHRAIIPQDPDLEFIPQSLLQRDKCPACFTESLCDEMRQGIVKMRPQLVSDKDFKTGSMYFGKYEEDEVLIKTLVPETDWGKFDEFLCRNVTGSTSNCNVSTVILKSYMAQPERALTIPHLKEAYSIVHKNVDGFP